MKILYAIQATGNGHISRAIQLMPYLQRIGTVDTILSGSNSTLKPNFEVTYRSKGLSLFYKKCGDLDYKKMFLKNNMLKARSDAKTLPVEKYDLILNDFEYITALACKKKNISSIQFGHQASFMSDLTPRPAQKSFWGELILKHYAKASNYVGLHFESYDNHIFSAIIKDDILFAEPTDQGHITVYLPSFDKICLKNHFEELSEFHFHWFTHDVDQPYVEGNIYYFPISNHDFTKSLIHCHGIITGGGFETPAEALYLNKKLMSIPIKNHYEQHCNAAALDKLGAKVLWNIDSNVWTEQIRHWIQEERTPIVVKANKVDQTLEHILALNERMRA